MAFIPHLSVEECQYLLSELSWSMRECSIIRRHVTIWLVFGSRREQRILGKAYSRREAWLAAVMASAAAADDLTRT